ncbi:Neutral protease [Seminavis robusta]|uniref:Neutral protease n=1 Tax=Seminavis robusta TaxID=568900 RepID=A0A9N8H2Z3_9STRA|nr:Neutral protease [Seminavis robusta]|eukprot:Sro47_g027860.1 Neutral protease (596) ;mRNA; f:86658-88514
MANPSEDQQVAPTCIGTRHRLQENFMGVPVYGADVLVTTSNCVATDIDMAYSSLNHDGSSLNTLTAQLSSLIQDLHGNTFASIDVAQGYTPSKTKQDAIVAIAADLNVQVNALSDPTLEVFVSTNGDFLAYRSYGLVEAQGWTDQIEIVIDAHDMSILSKCWLTGGNQTNFQRQRRLRTKPSEAQHRNLFSCKSCAGTEAVEWFDSTTTCPINSLYLDDTQQSTICNKGQRLADGVDVEGPGPVPEIHWNGTLDCRGTEVCAPVILPNCRDAISDVQFGGVATMKFLRDHLGIMGGLSEDTNSPVPVRALAHYQDDYCNAFYSSTTNAVYLGDCNCHTWSPLVSLDIVGHEIFHGVTAHTSDLVYSGQPGGLNEAFSDIFGATLEFYVNDYNDPPDFTVAEQVGQALRNMEAPLYKSIGDVCEYTSGMRVHYSSGAMNKAYVNSVRQCETSMCDDLRGCAILLGTVFLYSNVKGLTQTSNFLDAAEASCWLVEEFFLVRSPASTCTSNQVQQFIRDGWSTVGVTVLNDCRAVDSCPTLEPSVSPTGRPTITPQPTIEGFSSAPSEAARSDGDNDDGDDSGSSCQSLLRSILFFWV